MQPHGSGDSGFGFERGIEMPLASPALSRRERQVLDVILRLGSATVAQIQDGLADPPSNSAVRSTLRTLEAKGHLCHEKQGPRFLYRSTIPREVARESAVQYLIQTYFPQAPEAAVHAVFQAACDGMTTDGRLRVLQQLQHDPEPTLISK